MPSSLHPSQSINFSVIAPAAYLRDFVAQTPATIHHVAAQRVLLDPVYREFFLEEERRGATIILDNGVFDLGRSLSPCELVRAARAVKAEEIILSDVIRDAHATMRASDSAAAQILDMSDEFRLCAVVQAADDKDWRHCYDHFATRDHVGAIAFPASRGKEPSSELSKNRVAATDYLEAHGMINADRIYRLLGLGRTGHLELFEQRHHEWISSVDAAAPVLLGAMGLRMLPDGPYQKTPTPRVEAVQHIEPDRFALIRDNIKAVRYAANCPIEIRTPI
ncbi:hypothetical protein SAMN05444920_10159 [Nonomuraea solani]|uniref:Uncharacterized protein n=1 Tax=Nonomuraea solani TaxID=1144553 RepID=A0A1H5SZZ7_9ACTN|nr:hypothetical protein [Nonomuraea solani]SEF55498.1 hypothetical protein SAMN05444920_10159 [Nonomuraea solani]